MGSESLEALLHSVQSGQVSVTEAIQSLKDFPFQDLDYAKVDHHRGLRNGYPEVIFCQGKAHEHVKGIVEAMIPRETNILLTRVTPDLYEYLNGSIPDLEYHEIARLIVVKQQPFAATKSRILTATGGTSDIPVAEEAAITAEVRGNTVDRLYDVGVAGIHRLLANRDKLDQANVLIVVAGMEGALPSVIGGLVDKPVIAVPTSVGYGAHFQGLASLLAMLNSCASGIGVVNIDNGFGAGYLASTINRQIELAARREA